MSPAGRVARRLPGAGTGSADTGSADADTGAAGVGWGSAGVGTAVGADTGRRSRASVWSSSSSSLGVSGGCGTSGKPLSLGPSSPSAGKEGGNSLGWAEALGTTPATSLLDGFGSRWLGIPETVSPQPSSRPAVGALAGGGLAASAVAVSTCDATPRCFERLPWRGRCSGRQSLRTSASTPYANCRRPVRNAHSAYAAATKSSRLPPQKHVEAMTKSSFNLRTTDRTPRRALKTVATASSYPLSGEVHLTSQPFISPSFGVDHEQPT